VVSAGLEGDAAIAECIQTDGFGGVLSSSSSPIFGERRLDAADAFAGREPVEEFGGRARWRQGAGDRWKVLKRLEVGIAKFGEGGGERRTGRGRLLIEKVGAARCPAFQESSAGLDGFTAPTKMMSVAATSLQTDRVISHLQANAQGKRKQRRAGVAAHALIIARISAKISATTLPK
jgi:hypothetical protein